MKIIMLCLLAIGLAGCQACGLSSRGNEAVGQVKKVITKTPFACPDYTATDISLGIMINGVGSMSHEDLVLAVDNEKDVATLKQASLTGELVSFTYDDFRHSICSPDEHLTSVHAWRPGGSGSGSGS